MRLKRVTVLEYALLGLAAQKPRSGYEFIKLFRDTPMAHYSDSPGAIYPALARLEAAGLMRGKIERAYELRPRREFAPTQRGALELTGWLRQLPSRDDVSNRLDEVMLRFAFMDAHLSATECRMFLKELEKSLAAHLRGLKKYVRAVEGQVSRHGWLALGCGMMACATQLRWARRTLASYEKEPATRASTRV